MKCNKCGGALTVNNKGQITCPTCSSIKRKVQVQKFSYNAFTAYRVLNATNIVVDEFILPKELEELINKGVEVVVK